MADMKKEIEKLFDKEVPDVYGLSQAKFCVTLSDHHYLTLANYAANEVRRLCVDLSLWNEHSNKNGVEVYLSFLLAVI